MPRTLTTNAIAEKNKATGASPRWILEIQWGGATGTKYYGTETIASPVVVDGRVVSFGELQLSAGGQTASSNGSMSVSLTDTDYELKALIDTKPGIQNKPAWVHLWFEGTDWSDKVTLFGGIITSPMKFSTDTGTWDMSIKGFEHHFNRDVGHLITRDEFPEVACEQTEGKILPIVYGKPVYRSPGYVINRPGTGLLAATLNVVPDTALTLNVTAKEGGFTSGSTISLAVGTADRYEIVTGSFADENTAVFDIETRGAIEFEGQIPGTFGSGGNQYVLLPTADMPDASGVPLTAGHRIGQPLYMKQQDDSWVFTLIQYWHLEGNAYAVIESHQFDIVTGSEYKVGSERGVVPVWYTGTLVKEIGTWTYVVNHVPSISVDRVESKANINGTDVWMTYDEAHYIVDVDDKSFNTILGRGVSDPGVTTVTLNGNPQQLGFTDESIWVTIESVLSNPADVLKDLLRSPYVGNVDVAHVEESTFAQAALEIPTLFAFTLLETKKLHELMTDLAMQAGCYYFWDQGRAVLKHAKTELLPGDVVQQHDESHVFLPVEVSDTDVKKLTTQMISRFRMAIPAPDIKLSRKSQPAIDEYGENRQEINLWAYQYPTSVALITEQWLLHRLKNTRMIEFELPLVAVNLRPGDVVELSIVDGHNRALVPSGTKGWIKSLRHQIGNPLNNEMEKISVTLSVPLWDWVIEVDTPDDKSCSPAKPFSVTGQTRSNIQADHNGLFVEVQNAGGDGGQALHQPVPGPDVDPSAKFRSTDLGQGSFSVPDTGIPDYGGGGGGVSCPPQNFILDIDISGTPTGGTFDVHLTVNAVTETLTFNYDDDKSAVKTEFETHSEIAVDDVTVTVGPFPGATMRIEFVANLANTDIPLPTSNRSGLIGGVGVTCSSAQWGIE